MRKGLVVGVALASLFIAGCGGGEAETPPEPGGSSAPAPTSETKESTRTAPVKSLDLGDKCAIVTEDQARSLGADQPPVENSLRGKAGCDYKLGQTGRGWMTFVAADTSETMQDFAEMRSSSVEMTKVGGYPAAKLGENGKNCIQAVDVSDQGSLYINTLSPKGEPDPCELATKFAEAAVKNLPDA